jgi:sRNA-binding carbon storage regulator CsrA
VNAIEPLPKKLTTLKLDVKVGESVSFDNGRINMTLLDKSGRLARLEIKAPEDVKIKHHKIEVSSHARNGLTIIK